MRMTAAHASPRCGAKTRAGGCCALPRIRGRPRCRLHGGRHYCGARIGNRNALKTGLHTAVKKAHRRRLWGLERHMRATQAQVKDLIAGEMNPVWARDAEWGSRFIAALDMMRDRFLRTGRLPGQGAAGPPLRGPPTRAIQNLFHRLC